MRYASWSIIIDDIVFPDGRTAMQVLGGGGLHAVGGMRIWSDDVGILARVGEGFDERILAGLRLREHGLLRGARGTPRAWQLFEENGHRTQIPRVPTADWDAQLAWPDDFAELLTQRGVRAAHMLSRGLERDPGILARIAAAGVRMSLEPIIEEGMDTAQAERVIASLPHVELFSPGLGELRALMGGAPPRQALAALAARGPRVVALRRGPAGSLVYERESGRLLRVPAARATVVDVTGAGNAFVGGLLVGWCESGDLALAAASASVSAALALEQRGPATISDALLADARRRRDELLGEIREVGDGEGDDD